mmetsp:Transcript_99318/g.286626  ORF Transcript_99318/g.286626 Transcript_99318/m.286626 type:complete len:83 (+) Transcript_99318:2327-2575(+)
MFKNFLLHQNLHPHKSNLFPSHRLLGGRDWVDYFPELFEDSARPFKFIWMPGKLHILLPRKFWNLVTNSCKNMDRIWHLDLN